MHTGRYCGCKTPPLTIDSRWKQSFVEVSVPVSVQFSPLSELVEAADDHLFNNILCYKEHVSNSVLLSSIQLIYESRDSSN